MSEKLWFLKNCQLFERLTSAQIERLEARSRVRSFEQDSPIYLPAENATAVYLLAKGRVKICHLTEDGKESILAFVKPGELFGELAILESGAREEYVEAIEPATIVMIPADEVRLLMREHSEVSIGVVKLIGLRRRRIERRLKNLLFLSNRDRLVHLLLDLAEEYGSVGGQGISLGIKLSHQDLASVIGSTRETVTVVLGQLRAEGMVQNGRKKIVIIKPGALAASINRAAPRLTQPSPQLSPVLRPHLASG